MSSSSTGIDSENIKRDTKSLAGLLGFAHEVLTARSKVQMEMASGLGVFRESDFAGLPGVHLNEEDGAWLRLERQRETRPPAPEEHVAAFVADIGDDPDKRPELQPAVSIEVTIEAASDLAEAELLRPDNIREIVEDNQELQDRVKVTLLVEDFLAVQQGFKAYVTGPWARWAEAEKPVRKAIKLYKDLFALQTAIHSAESTPPELVWGVGIARWKVDGKVVDMPILEQLVDVEVEERGDIAFRPRDLKPKLSLKPFIELEVEGSPKLQRVLQGSLEKILDEDTEFSPFQTVWETLLSTAAAQLTSNAELITREALDSGAQIPAMGDQLIIASSWAIFGRPRSSEAREQDLQALRKTIEETAAESELPSALRGFAAVPPETPVDSLSDYGLDTNVLQAGGATNSWEESSRGTPGSEPRRVEALKEEPRRVHFFPLPYNQEQGKVIDLLETADVVSVTGPPGTGKTHSIANIISHMMATGKRVLVTARTPEAIAAVREKLPESLRPLVIASVGTDRESAKQLQSAVSELSDKVIGMDKDAARQEMQRLEAAIVECDRKADEADLKLAEIARENLAPLVWQGQEYAPMELLDVLSEDENRFGWFTDRPSSHPPSQLSEILQRLRDELPSLSPDIVYVGADVPAIEAIPSTQSMIEAHDAELAYHAQEKPDYSNAPPMARDSAEADSVGRDLLVELKSIQQRLAKLDEHQRRMVAAACSQGLDGDVGPSVLKRKAAYIEEHRYLELAAQVTYTLGKSSASELVDAAQRAAAGQKPVSFGFFNKPLKEAVSSIKLGEQSPDSREGWVAVHTACRLEVDREQIVAEFSPFVTGGYPPEVPLQGPQIAEYLVSCSINIETAMHLSASLHEAMETLRMLFPYGLDQDAMVRTLDLSGAIFALEANLPDSYQTPEAIQMLENLELREEVPVHKVLMDLRRGLGSPDLDHATLVALRGELTQELQRIAELGSRLQQLERDLEALEQAGAPEWGARLRKDPLQAAELIPEEWEAAWEWAMMRERIDRIIALGNGDEHRTIKANMLERRRRHFEKLISTRTMLGLAKRMTPTVQSAMAAFTQAVSRIGKGTGKNAPRFVRAAQEAAQKASKAAPVWVMPEYKIPEQLPPQLGDFDLVILDEASQSDITALAALARGKKLLIVGDEEQVSPSNVGIPSERINAMRAEYLHGVPNAALIDENASIFEITMRMYPATHMVLREHFRCVAPIIQFSTRFYSNRLIPLRVPKASERFDPPLVDVYLPRASRRGKTNRDEANYIVDEIANIIADPAHDHRSIGIISLLGNHQAELIERLLIEDSRIGPEKIAEREIIAGDARTMQGQERSVVFISMVATPSDVRSQSAKSDQQRVNVAMSRAADRLYLVRSVSLEDLKPQDIKSDIIKHLQDPMPEGHSYSGGDLLARCDSGFEREVLSMLLDANYRVRPQVEVGGFSIDLVVEGAEDRRLAIELDGDAFHGPDVWEKDMARQAVLERAGWVFWRIFGSQWRAQKDYWWNQLLETLTRMGIDPIGAEALDERFTDFRVIQPFGQVKEDELSTAEIDDFGSPDPNGKDDAAEEITIEGKGAQSKREPTDDAHLAEGNLELDLSDLEESQESEASDTEATEDIRVVQVGSEVVVEQMFGDHRVMRFTIVENYNAPQKGLLGSHTPLGQALLDASAGEEVEYHQGDDHKKVRLIEVL
ncbi:AAA domain-containing protein [Halomonas sp. IOP_31]|uniref:AAA domain-containing protein n=1 Tax=Halomonas sp. IOP_31 TaxID=2876584 RepID=UPI001E29B074|nr:AAA domain-containing protein [Halomonas sp. IOP_31]MCD6007629.1 AAA family ATPase [Halomonas sp. IOP_31]